MNLKTFCIFFISFHFQFVFSQKTIEEKFEKAKIVFYVEKNYIKADSLIQEVKKPYKSVPPRVSYLEILIKYELIKDLDTSFALIEKTRKLISNYKINFVKYQNDNFKSVIKIGNELDKYPKDIYTFNKLKEQREKELAKIKEIEKQRALIAIQKAEEERLKKIEEEKVKKIANERREKLRPYINPNFYSDFELANFSESGFIELLNKLKRESVLKKEEDIRINKIKLERTQKIQKYISYVSYKIRDNLGVYTDQQFDNIYKKAKDDYKAATKPKIGRFSSLGFQSGEIAKYGIIFEVGGKKTIGFRFTGRTSLTPKQDILNQIATKNKTDIDFGPNFKLFKRIYFNIGIGYGYYNRPMNNDYAGKYYLVETGYTVATSGIMFRLNRVISINGGVSFMDIEKDIYKPEISFGISFNLKGKN